MLVLAWRAGETLNIGEQVKITILEILSNQVRIGMRRTQGHPG